MNNQLIAQGSVKDVALKQNKSLAYAFLSVKVVILADRSGSMRQRDAKQGQSRAEVEDELVRRIQKEHPGEVLLASFNDHARLHPEGILPDPEGGTMMLPGLEKVKDLCVGDVRCVLISDGEPFEGTELILNYVRQHFQGRLDTMYAGPEHSDGYELMKAIAQAAQGSSAFDVLNQNLPKLEQSIRFALGAG